MPSEKSEGGTPVYDISQHTWGYEEEGKRDSTFLCTFALLILLGLVVSSVIARRLRCSLFPEATVVLTVGLLAGFLTKAIAPKMGFFSGPLLGFSNALFFLGLLPPIIFASGWALEPKWLFGLFLPILCFALAGTFLSAVIVGGMLSTASHFRLVPPVSFAETLTFGALVSATDPVSVIAVFTELRVHPKMFYLLFGESVLNDAVGIVLFKTFAKYVGYSHNLATLAIALCDFLVVFIGSMILGGVCAIGTAFVLKIVRVADRRVGANPIAARAAAGPSPEGYVDARLGVVRLDANDNSEDELEAETAHAEEEAEHYEEAVAATQKVQLAALACAIYLPAFLAELVELSGIVAVLFAAIGIRHWGLPNLQELERGDGEALKMADTLVDTLNHLADLIVFLYLGLSVPATTDVWLKVYSHSMVAFSVLACLVGRAAHVYPISWAINYYKAASSVSRADNGARVAGQANAELRSDRCVQAAHAAAMAERSASSRDLLEPDVAANSADAAAYSLAETAAAHVIRSSVRRGEELANEIPRNMQHMLWFSGLRGAVAFSCANTFPDANGRKDLFATTTTAVIILSMYILGALTVPVLKKLKIPIGVVPVKEGDQKAAQPKRRLSNPAARSRPPKPLFILRALKQLDSIIYPLIVVPASPCATESFERSASDDSPQPPTSPRSPRSPGTTEMLQMRDLQSQEDDFEGTMV